MSMSFAAYIEKRNIKHNTLPELVASIAQQLPKQGLERFFTFQHIINMAHDFDIQYAYNMILLVLLVLFHTLFQALLMHAVDMMDDDKYVIGFHGMLC